jgi:hypothetical protein
MSAARLIPWPLIVLDLFSLTPSAETESRMSAVAAQIRVPVFARFAAGVGWPLEVAFAGESTPAYDQVSATDSNPEANERKSASASAEFSASGATPLSHGRMQPPSPVSKTSNTILSASPAAASQQQLARIKSPSILQILDGHELELLMAAALALSCFVIGWICGGNYYLRRDRRLRRKITL